MLNIWRFLFLKLPKVAGSDLIICNCQKDPTWHGVLFCLGLFTTNTIAVILDHHGLQRLVVAAIQMRYLFTKTISDIDVVSRWSSCVLLQECQRVCHLQEVIEAEQQGEATVHNGRDHELHVRWLLVLLPLFLLIKP